MTVEVQDAPDLSQRPSSELRARLTELEALRRSATEDLEEQRVLRVSAERVLADIEDRVVRGHETGLDKEIAKAEAKIADLDRQIRAFGTARDRTLSETQAEFDALTAAIPLAEQREAEEAREAAAAARRAAILETQARISRGLFGILGGLEELLALDHGVAHLLGGNLFPSFVSLELAINRLLPEVDGVRFERTGRVPWGWVADSGKTAQAVAQPVGSRTEPKSPRRQGVTRLRVRVNAGHEVIGKDFGTAPAGAELVLDPGERVDALVRTGAVEVIGTVVDESEADR